jgi:hypothetical protein
MNASLPHIYGVVKNDILFGMTLTEGVTECVIFGATSIPARCLHFSVMLDTGAQWARIPLHMLGWQRGDMRHKLQDLQVWDCMGWDFEVITYDYLREMECEVLMGEKRVPGRYWVTVDHTDNPYSNHPPQHKTFVLVKLLDGSGQIAAMPNNRILWRDPSFVDQKELPRYRTMAATTWHCEQQDIQKHAITKD